MIFMSKNVSRPKYADIGLCRTKYSDSYIAGVVGGIARFFNLPTGPCRFVYFLGLIMGPLQFELFLLYLILWVVLPKEYPDIEWF